MYILGEQRQLILVRNGFLADLLRILHYRSFDLSAASSALPAAVLLLRHGQALVPLTSGRDRVLPGQTQQQVEISLPAYLLGLQFDLSKVLKSVRAEILKGVE